MGAIARNLMRRQGAPAPAAVPAPAVNPESREVSWDDLHATAAGTPMVLSPWLVEQVLEIGPRVPVPVGRP